jgi:hypothetical protein
VKFKKVENKISGNACNYASEKLASSHLLSKY